MIPGRSQVVFENTDGRGRHREFRAVRVGLQTAIGYINPDEVNNYIQDYISRITSGGVYYNYGGSAQISVQAAFNLSIIAPVGPKIRLIFPLEYGAASKTITIDNNTERFTISRFGPGMIGEYYFYPGSNDAFFGGLGFLYDFMWFVNQNALAFAPRFELGYSFFGQTTEWQFLLLADFARGKVSSSSGYPPFDSIDFTGPLFAIRLIL